MSDDFSKKNQTGKAGRRTFTVTVGLSTVISSILVVCTGFVAMFALGVLLGRGYDPEAGIPELERMMPQPGRPSAPVVISEGDAGDDASVPAPQEHAGILGQGDLAYPESLRTPHSTAVPKPQQQPKPPKQDQAAQPTRQNAQTQARTTQRQGGGAETTRSPGLTPLPMTGTAPVRTSARNQEQAADQRVYHYSYQTAAYKDEASCDRFTARLKSAGLNARTQKSTDNGVTWYRVMVDFTGRPDDTDALRAKLQSLGAGKPLMKSKVPAR